MAKRILIFIISSFLVLSACGTKEVAQPEVATENSEATDVVESNAPEIVENTDEEVIEEIEEPEIEHVDTDKRGNTTGNLANGGLTCTTNEGEFLFYTPYDEAVGIYRKSDETSELVIPAMVNYINVYDDYMYGITINSNRQETILFKQNLINNECEFIKQGTVISVSVVNDYLYYVDIDGKLYSRSIETDEEKCLINEGVGLANIYKEKIYYIDTKHNNGLYVSDIDGTNPVCLYEAPVENIILYEDYIYFSAYDSLRRLSIEGGTAQIMDEVVLNCFNIADDTLYYVDANDLDYIYFIDLNSDLEPQKIDFKKGLITYYYDCEGDKQETVEIIAYNNMNISDNYMYLYAYFSIDGKENLAEFCYDLSNYAIPVVKSQPNERFDFDNYDAYILTWVLADNDKEYETLAGKKVNIQYSKESLDELKKMEENGEHPTVDKVEQPSKGQANVASLDQASVQAAIYSLQAEYPEGRSWDMGNYVDFHGGVYSGGYGCAAFSFAISDAVFGTLPARRIYDINAARIGDVINVTSPTTHSMVVLSVNEDSITVCEGNYNNSVHWGRTISKDELQAGLSEILTRYP